MSYQKVTEMTSTAARANFGETIARVQHGNEIILLTKHGKEPTVAIVSMATLALIEQASQKKN